jgi:hypothetical protein
VDIQIKKYMEYMKKIIDKLISHSIVGADVYRYKDATWLILTDEKRWVVELTDEGTLWYNYNFFNNILRYVSLECGGESKDYIIGWANDYFFKDIKKTRMGIPRVVNTVINKGVKNVGMGVPGERAADIVINEGVMEIQGDEEENKSKVIFVMNKGVKEIKTNMLIDANPYVINVIENGVKEIKTDMLINPDDINAYVFNVIENGIKNIYPDKIPHDYDWSDEFDVNKVVGGGVKV